MKPQLCLILLIVVDASISFKMMLMMSVDVNSSCFPGNCSLIQRLYSNTPKRAGIRLLMMMVTITFKFIYTEVAHNTCKSLQHNNGAVRFKYTPEKRDSSKQNPTLMMAMTSTLGSLISYQVDITYSLTVINEDMIILYEEHDHNTCTANGSMSVCLLANQLK